LDHLSSQLRKLQIQPFEIKTEKITREGMSGVDLKVVCRDPHHHDHDHHDHGHSHHGHHHFGEIREMIEKSTLDSWIKEKAIQIFTRLAEAEAKVHESTVEDVHFHEVGALDSIVDIVGSCIGFRFFEIGRFASSPLELGGGTVTFSHGTWPVPAPATAELVKGFPVRLGGAQAELTTPTGAAIVTTLADAAEIPESFQIESIGTGAGDRRIDGIPNMLRLILGKSAAESDPVRDEAGLSGPARDKVIVLEFNVDDMLPENLGFFMERALEEGALDLFFTPVFMKKSRPATQVTLISPLEKEEALVGLAFRNTSSLGIRRRITERYTLEREIIKIDTEFGEMRVKRVFIDGKPVFSPEYEDLKEMARENNLSLDQARQRIMKRVSDEDFE